MTTFYKPRELTPAVRDALEPYEDYRTGKRVRELVEKAVAPNADDFVCLASLEWNDAMATDFDEDAMQGGASALADLEKARALEPDHPGATKLEKQIARRMKSAAKAIKKIEKLAQVDEATLDLSDAKELAFVILDNAGSSPELLRKAHRLSTRLVREHPDVTPGTPPFAEHYGHNLYHLNQAASALWRAGDHEDARPLMWQVIDWPVARDVAQYDFAIRDCVEPLLLEALEKNDASEIGRLVHVLQARFAAVGKKAWLSDGAAERLHAFALTHCEPEMILLLDGLRKRK